MHASDLGRDTNSAVQGWRLTNMYLDDLTLTLTLTQGLRLTNMYLDDLTCCEGTCGEVC